MTNISKERPCAHGTPFGQPCNDCVICPECAHQFQAIPVNVQRELQRLREQVRVPREILKRRIDAGHNDTCDARLLKHDKTIACSCGHADLELIAAAQDEGHE